MATEGFLVQVPKRLVYSMETVGDRPSLRFEVLMANSQTMYPGDETPPPTPGIRFEKTRVANSKGSYDGANVPYIDYNQVMAGKPLTKKNPTQFVGDAHDGGYVNVGIANILRGNPRTQKPAPPGDKGHLHVTGPEFWFVLEGKMESTIGSVPTFVADQGDIIYAPATVWHGCDSQAPRWRQDSPSSVMPSRMCFQGTEAQTARCRQRKLRQNEEGRSAAHP